LPGLRVVRELEAIVARRSRPAMCVSDNGTELTAMAVLRWCQEILPYELGIARAYFVELNGSNPRAARHLFGNDHRNPQVTRSNWQILAQIDR
jgi:hypothetical protein